MARSCAICGKVSMGGFNPQSSGMNRVRAHRRMKPNLQPLVIEVKGTPTKSLVCTRCRRTLLEVGQVTSEPSRRDGPRSIPDFPPTGRLGGRFVVPSPARGGPRPWSRSLVLCWRRAPRRATRRRLHRQAPRYRQRRAHCPRRRRLPHRRRPHRRQRSIAGRAHGHGRRLHPAGRARHSHGVGRRIGVGQFADGSVARVDTKTARSARRSPSERGEFGSLAVGDGAVWVTTFDEDKVSRIDPVTNKIGGGDLPSGPIPRGSP